VQKPREAGRSAARAAGASPALLVGHYEGRVQGGDVQPLELARASTSPPRGSALPSEFGLFIKTSSPMKPPNRADGGGVELPPRARDVPEDSGSAALRVEEPREPLQDSFPGRPSTDAGMQTEESELGALGSDEQRPAPAPASPSAEAVGLSGGTLALEEKSFVGTLEGGNSDGGWHWDVERSYDALGRVGHEAVPAQVSAPAAAPAPPDAGAEAQRGSVKRSALPTDAPAQQDEGPEEEEDRQSYSASPVEPDAEIDLASALLWDDYRETLAQFLSRLFQETSKVLLRGKSA
jgi:hypothetical protein